MKFILDRKLFQPDPTVVLEAIWKPTMTHLVQ